VRDESHVGSGTAPGRHADQRRRAIRTERESLPTHVRDTAALPDAYERALTRGLAELDLSLYPDARAAIDGHLRLLLAWTAAINLTAIRDPEAAATAHVLDSLSAVPLLRRLGVARFLDLGSGGGLPGIPLAAALGIDATLAEPIGKKAGFLRVALAATGLDARVSVDARRAEALATEPAHRGRWPAVTARAVASTGELVELAFPLLAPGGRLVAWKRGDLAAELAGAERAMAALGGGELEVQPVSARDLPGHVLVVARRAGGHVPGEFPRDPAARRRRPW
jgi:16S rRNA (guanine527-N7)-methyltransferase